MAESLIVVDTNGAIRMVNQVTVDLLGCDEKKLLGKRATVICGVATPGGGMQETVMDVYRDYEGREIPVLFSRAPLRGMNGAISGEVWMAQDMTERQRAQEELVVAKDAAENANRAKSLFLTTMSHELRTPLNAILGFAQLLRIEMEDAGMERWDGDLDKIERAGHMELMIESADVAGLVRSAATTAEPLAAKNRNRISVSVMPATMMVDPLRVQQCLLNLIGNACKFTQEGEIAVEGVAQSGCYRVIVRDSGIGIERQDIARLFGDFAQVDASTTRKYGGAGLGLAISRRFARLMGGDITVESVPGHWFHLYPASARRAGADGGIE